LAYLGVSSPGWTRTTDRLLVRKLLSPLGHRTVLSGSRGTRTPKSRARPTVFKTAPSSSRMTSVSCGGWNRTNIRAFRAPRPTVERPRIVSCASSGGRNRTYGLLVQGQASLPAATTPECLLTSKSALWESNPPRQLGRLEPLPLGQGHIQRKERESNPQGSSLDCFETAAIAHWLALLFELRRQESNLRQDD
jgi:hypothetical protein